MIKNTTIITLLLFISSCSIDNKLSKNSMSFDTSKTKPVNISEIIEHNNKVIIRDSWGIPHIYGSTDTDAAYALAYAHAEDDFITIQNALLKARGEYASVYGPGENNINAIMDYVVGLLKVWDTIDKKYNTDLDIETIELCEAYADGINAYINDYNHEIDEHIYPVSGKDIIAGTVHKTPFFFQLPLFLSDLYFKSPDQIPEHYSRSDVLDKIKGSNVYALSPKVTKNKNTILGINAHQPYEGELAWYEAHINSKEGWNMIGGLFPGSPIILVGHNEHLGWGHTVNKPDILDIYDLEINPENENQYKFDNEWHDMEVFEVLIKIKVVGKVKIKRKQKAYWSIHGPVIKGEKSTYAIRYSNMDNIQAIEQWYKMNKSNNLDSWLKAIEPISVPMFNTGYADKEGNIFYVYSAKTPIRNPKYNWGKVLPGNTSETLWDSYKTFDDLPKVLNPKSGFIQNCNSSPFQTTTGDDNPSEENFDHTYGIEKHMTNRALRTLETIGNDLSISYEEFINYKFDTFYSKSSIMNFIVKKSIDILDNETLPSDIYALKSKIKNTLINWDLSSNKENINAALPIIAFDNLLSMDKDDIKNDMIIQQLSLSASYLIKHYNAINIEWGQVNRIIRGNINKSLDGAPDVPRAIYTTDYKNGQRKAIAGDCYILIANWDKNGTVSSQSIHQYGSSTSNVESKHYNDQVKLFSTNKLKDVSIYLDDIAKDIKSITILDKDIN